MTKDLSVDEVAAELAECTRWAIPAPPGSSCLGYIWTAGEEPFAAGERVRGDWFFWGLQSIRPFSLGPPDTDRLHRLGRSGTPETLDLQGAGELLDRCERVIKGVGLSAETELEWRQGSLVIARGWSGNESVRVFCVAPMFRFQFGGPSGDADIEPATRLVERFRVTTEGAREEPAEG